MAVALLLPPGAIVRRFLPSQGAAYGESLVRGLWCFKALLLWNGLLLLALPLLRRLWSWSAGAAIEDRPLFRRPAPVWRRREVAAACGKPIPGSWVAQSSRVGRRPAATRWGRSR